MDARWSISSAVIVIGAVMKSIAQLCHSELTPAEMLRLPASASASASAFAPSLVSSLARSFVHTCLLFLRA